MRVAIHFPNFTFPGEIAPTIAATAKAADAGGCADFTCMDHWFQMEQFGGPRLAMLEGYTTLGYLAAHTERIRLGLLVTGVTYRHPGLLAKIVTTLDVLSQGRAQLGIGAAWYEEEHLGLGVPYPDISERFERLEEAIQICNQMWSDDDGPYNGKHYQLAQTLNDPQPASKPRILIGGSGEKKTLKLVAKYADATNLFAPSLDVIQHKLEVLQRHCDDVGRDNAEIDKTMISAVDVLADPDAFVADMERYAKIGIDQVWLSAQSDDPAGWVSRVCEQVVPRLAELG